MIAALDRPVTIEYIPMPDDLMGKYQNYTCADMAKSQNFLQTKYSLEAGVKDYVHNHLLPNRTW